MSLVMDIIQFVGLCLIVLGVRYVLTPGPRSRRD
jgi:hypothetical protein